MKWQEHYEAVNSKTRQEIPYRHLHWLIDEVCDRRGEAVAVVSVEGSHTYRDLKAESDLVASFLRLRGIGQGDLVGLCCDRTYRLPALLLGIMKSGAGYVPLDPEYPLERLKYMVEDSGARFVLANDAQRDIVDTFGVPVEFVENGWNGPSSQPLNPNIETGNPETDLAYVIYTSGSTGKPKGVLLPHLAVVNFLYGMMEKPGFGQDDRILATTTLSFDISVLEIFLPLLCGGSVAIVDRQTARDTAALVQAMKMFDINTMQATPAMWRMILETEFEGNPDLKFYSAGEPLPRDLIRPLLSRCGELWNLYGPTETTVYSTVAKIDNDPERVLVGTPIINTQVYIVDEQGDLCPPEHPGELLIGGMGLALGYLNRPEQTAERFTQWQEIPVYRTGDLALLTENGEFQHLGRMDNQIKFNGHRIELGEIDAAMAMQPGVRQAATVMREDRPGERRLVGYVLKKENEDVDLARVREGVAERLPEYMVPSVVVVVEEFPYTPSGKLDRKSFAPPSTARPSLVTEYVAPEEGLERDIATIWQDVLQLDEVGVADNFFELGGNSLRAVKFIARAKKELGLDLSGAEFFDNPSIAALLKFLGQRDQTQAEIQKRLSASPRQGDEKDQRYAIVGMAARMPGAKDLTEYWDNLIHARESIRFFSPDELDPTLDPRDTSDENYVAARGILDQADEFDARFFRMPPRNAELLDPQQRILMELAWTALEDAGVIPAKTNESIGIWAGSYTTNYFTKNILTNPERVREVGEFNAGVFNEKDYIATRVAHALNLKGPAINVNTACSTSLVALIEACQSLQAGHCDVALAGGVSVTFPQRSGHVHQTGSIFSPDGHCRPFDSQAAGTLFCDGAGLVVVKRLADAIENNDRIYAVVRGFGINNDGGEKASFSAPSIAGQADAIAMAQGMAGVSAEQIGYVEAHGTATPIGDPIEVTALRSVFETQTDKKQYCGLGSVKSNIGHTVAAAGVAGLIKIALSLHCEQIPATLHYQQPNPEIDFANSPFYVCDQLTQWPRSNEPRYAAVSSFGVGGTNAHVLLEEAPVDDAAKNEPANLPVVILPVSGKTEAALDANVNQLAEFFADLEPTHRSDLDSIAGALQMRRDEFQYRAAAVVDTITDACEIFQQRKAPKYLKRKSSAKQRDIVFMFPGQGSQYVRMGKNFYDQSPVFRENLDRCSEYLLPLLGRDLRHVLFPDPGDEDAAQEILKNTEFTQPALFSMGYSLAQVWLSWGFQPSALMGHSIGEFAAACVAGVFRLEDGLKMIAERGRAMQALPPGSMMSVRLPGAEVEPLLSGDLAIGSYNGPKLCVVSGPDDQIAELQKKLESQEVVCRYLHTSHAFHSPMMDSIVEPFAEFVSQFELKVPQLPVLSTVTGEWMTDEEATDPNYWANHLREPVQFSGAVQRMWDEREGDPDRILIELGPRKTLATLAKQHAQNPKEQIALPTMSDNSEDQAEWFATLNAVTQLWLAGARIEWEKISGDERLKSSVPHRDLPTYSFQRKRYFIEPGRSVVSEVTESPNVQTRSDESTTIQPPISNSKKTEVKIMSRIPTLVAEIQEVFENTSGFDLNDFDNDTTFFEMGLDSLVLTQTAKALKNEFEAEVTFRQLLEDTPNVETLAAWLDEQLPPEKFAAPVVPAEVPEVQLASQADSQEIAIERTVQAVSQEPAQQPLPLQAPTLPVAPTVNMTPGVGGSAMQQIVQTQLQLMQSQLQLLAGHPVAMTGGRIESASDAAIEVQSHAQSSSSNEQPAIQRTSAKESISQAAPIKPCRAKSEANSNANSHANDAPAAPKAKRFDTVKLNDNELTDEQQAALDHIIRMNNQMMPGSKAYAQKHRKYLADPRTVSGFRPNMKEMTHPIVVDRSKGVHLWDIDGNEYIDYTCGFGSNLLGHTHDITVQAITEQVQKDYAIGPQSPLAGEVAKLFCDVTGHERMAFSNTGSEAVLGCTRLARNATGRDLIVMFNGDYHGILDEVIARGSKKLKSFPAATGIPKDYVGNTLILDYGTEESLQIIRENLDQLAAILVEPVQSRRPELQPREFLQELARMTANEPTALIFDEVISGLRIGLGGAQEFFGVQADLASYGKVVGGGMPIGVIGGKAKYMDGLDGGYWEFGDDSRPEADMTYFAGTFVRHPLALAASKAILLHLKEGGQRMYDRINELSQYLADEMNRVFKELKAPLYHAHFGSLFKIQFEQELVYSELFFAGLRRRGMHIWDHRPCLLTLEHRKEHIDELVQATFDSIVECQRHGFMPGDGYQSVSKEERDQRPPQRGAKLGKDAQGNPGWFIPDTLNPGQYIPVSQ